MQMLMEERNNDNDNTTDVVDVELQNVGPAKATDSDSPFIQSEEVQEERPQMGICGIPSCEYKVYNPKKVESNQLTAAIVGDAFRSRASLAGLTEIHESSTGVKRIYWGILTVTAFILLVVHTFFLISRFAKFSTNIELKLTTEKLMDFPAVTICNNNMVQVSADPFSVTPTIRELDKYVDYLHLDDSKLGHQKESLIVNASFDNHLLDLKEFRLILNPHYGNCYTFNWDGNRKTRRALPGYGLNLQLNIESYKYNNFSDHNPPTFKGAIIKAHIPGTEAIMAEGGIIVGTNTINRLAIKKTGLTRLNGLYGHCFNDGDPKPRTFYEGNYTKEHCENSCLQREIITQCCCYVKLIRRDLSQFDDSWDTCYKRNITPCLDRELCWQKIWDSYDEGNLPCHNCYDRCQDQVYDVTVASAEWPTDDYFIGILAERLNTSSHFAAELESYKLNISTELIKQNFLEVQVYFESMATTYIDEVPAIGISEFASEIGSAVGFWAGWSVWTVFQFFELLSDLVAICVRKRKRK